MPSSGAATAVALDKQGAIGPLASIVGSGAEPVSLRQAVARQLGSTDTQEAREALATAIVTAPAALQQPLAVSHLSPMASNMLDQIGEKNLSDLLAYLMQQAARP